MFFLHVLAGEEPIDYLQRKALREQANLHPLLHRLMRIHTTEEARHVCFARQYLGQRVPKLGRVRTAVLRLQAPFVFAGTAALMLRPVPDVVRTYAIPPAVMRDAYDRNPRHHQLALDALAKVRALCEQLQILTPRLRPLWQHLGVA